MKVVEHQLTGKQNNPHTCEDDVIMTSDFVAVVDGTTSQMPRKNGISPGLKATRRLRNELEKMPGHVGASECFRKLNASITEIYREEGIYEKARCEPEYRCSAAAVIYSRCNSEIWLIGDCQGLIDNAEISDWKGADALLSEVRAMYLESEIVKGKSIDDLLKEDTGRQYIRELLIRQKVFQNGGLDSPYAFAILDGFLFNPEEVVRTYEVPKSCRTIVLASDGYPALKPTLEQSELALHQIISEDPLCFRHFKSTKGVYPGNVSFDDRAYIRMEAGR